jgi:hypothetical protein
MRKTTCNSDTTFFATFYLPVPVAALEPLTLGSRVECTTTVLLENNNIALFTCSRKLCCPQKLNLKPTGVNLIKLFWSKITYTFL